MKTLLPDCLTQLLANRTFELRNNTGDRRGDLWSPVCTGHMQVFRHTMPSVITGSYAL